MTSATSCACRSWNGRSSATELILVYLVFLAVLLEVALDRAHQLLLHHVGDGSAALFMSFVVIVIELIGYCYLWRELLDELLVLDVGQPLLLDEALRAELQVVPPAALDQPDLSPL